MVLPGISAVKLVKGNLVFCGLKKDIAISIKLTSGSRKVSVGISRSKREERKGFLNGSRLLDVHRKRIRRSRRAPMLRRNGAYVDDQVRKL